jgi:putative transposase
VILDLFSRLVVGWAMAATEDSALTELALRMAVARRHPEADLLHHSDRGTEDKGERYQAALQELGIEVSLSRTANAPDNAAMESFFATRTSECTDRVLFQTRQQARSAIDLRTWNVFITPSVSIPRYSMSARLLLSKPLSQR